MLQGKGCWSSSLCSSSISKSTSSVLKSRKLTKKFSTSTLSFLSLFFGNSLFFSSVRNSLFFCAFFPSFPGILGFGRDKKSLFWWVFLAIFPKNKERKDRVLVIIQKNSRRLWWSQWRKSTSVPEGEADLPAAIFLAGKCPNLGRDSILC